MDFDQLHTFLEIRPAKEFLQGRSDVLPHSAGDQRAGAPTGAGTARRPVRALREPDFADHRGEVFAEYAEQMLEMRKQAQNAVAELESSPRGELSIAANEANLYLPSCPRSFRSIASFSRRCSSMCCVPTAGGGGSGDGERRGFRPDATPGGREAHTGDKAVHYTTTRSG